MKHILLFITLLSNTMFIHAQTTEDYFSRPGLQISAYERSYTSGDYSKSYSYSHKTAFCGDSVLVFAYNEYPINIYMLIEDDKVYKINTNCDKELLFDFGLDMNEVIGEGYYQGFALISKEEITLLNGETRKKHTLQKVDGGYTYTWIEGIGDIRNGIEPWTGEGYNIFVCARDSTGMLWVNEAVVDKCDSLSCLYPRAAFSMTKDDLVVRFKNESLYNTEHSWDFGNGVMSMEQDPVYEYPEPGCYIATLRTSNACYDGEITKSRIVSACAVAEWDTVSTINVLQYSINFKWFPHIQFLYDYPEVFRSTDQGITWHQVSVPPEPAGDDRYIYDIKMYDDLLGIMACGHTSYEMGRNAVLVTDDGGLTWRETLPGSHVIHSLELGNNGLAWASGSVNRYYRSIDYGKTWEHLSDSTSFIPQQIWNFGDTLLIADGYESDPLYRHCTAKSWDDGLTWTCIPMPVAKFDQLYYTSPEIGFGYSFWSDTLYKTIDGGQNWFYLLAGMHIFEFDFATEEAGWINTSNGLVYYTNDAMQTYKISNCGGKQINYLSAVSQDSVLAIRRPYIVGFKAGKEYNCSLSDDDNDGFTGAVDCDDTNSEIYPGALEIADNTVDEDCDGIDLITTVGSLLPSSTQVFPNPVSETLFLKGELSPDVLVRIYGASGSLFYEQKGTAAISMADFAPGLYIFELTEIALHLKTRIKIVKL